jgi:hypothetical protein
MRIYYGDWRFIEQPFGTRRTARRRKVQGNRQIIVFT